MRSVSLVGPLKGERISRCCNVDICGGIDSWPVHGELNTTSNHHVEKAQTVADTVVATKRRPPGSDMTEVGGKLGRERMHALKDDFVD